MLPLVDVASSTGSGCGTSVAWVAGVDEADVDGFDRRDLID